MTNQFKILLPALLLCAMAIPALAQQTQVLDDVLLVKKVTRTGEDGQPHSFIQLSYEGTDGITIIDAKINRGDCIVDTSTGLEFPYKMGFDEKLKVRSMRGSVECNPMNVLIETNLGSKLFPLGGPKAP
jgi:hypothetical protein